VQIPSEVSTKPTWQPDRVDLMEQVNTLENSKVFQYKVNKQRWYSISR
jgi:hypothetical protein